MKYVVCEKAYDANHAGPKARIDCRDILALEGWEPIEIRRYGGSGILDKLRSIPCIASEWRHLCAGLSLGDVLLIQFPLDAYPQVSLATLPSIRRARRRGAKVIALVHDLDSLRGYKDNVERAYLSECDGVIAHNNRMVNHIESRGYCQNVVSLGIFDYLVREGQTFSPCEDGVDIAGNLSREKSGYVYSLATAFPEGHFNLYGPNFDKSSKEMRWYRGSYKPSELAEHLTGRFGLVWDGSSIETCEGPYGEYLRHNNPHKLSMYLALGKPVIIWSEAAEAEFVSEHGVGICAPSISSALDMMQSMSEGDYQTMRQNAQTLATSLRDGTHLISAINRLLDTRDNGNVRP